MSIHKRGYSRVVKCSSAESCIWILILCCLVSVGFLCESGCSQTSPLSEVANLETARAPGGRTMTAELGDSQGRPKIVLEKRTHDFNKIRPDSTSKACFCLTNAGGSTLQIADVKQCCGAVVNLDKRELAPAESTVLTAEYHAGQTAGVLRKQIGLSTNDPENPQIQLTIMGEVVPTLAWTPERFAIAEYEENVTCPQIVIRSLDGTPFSIKGLTATGRCLSAEFDPNHKATEFTLEPKVDINRLNALATGNGTIRIDLNHPDYEMIQLGFTVALALQATPAQLFVFNARAGESVLRPIQVRDNQADPNTGSVVQIDSVAFKNGGRVELRDMTASKTGCELKLEIWPVAGKENESFTTDQLVIRMKDGRELTVPVRVFYPTPAVSGTARLDSNL